jgi:hypothetical protein
MLQLLAASMGVFHHVLEGGWDINMIHGGPAANDESRVSEPPSWREASMVLLMDKQS